MSLTRLVLAALASSAVSVGIAVSALAQPAVLRANNPNARINLRAEPSATSRYLGYGLVGDRVEVLSQTRSWDGYTWYRVRFDNSRAEGWIRGDLVNVLDRRAETANSRRSLAPDATSTSLDYFLEVALGSEFGASDPRVRKWKDPVRIKVIGSPTAEDRWTLTRVVSELRGLTNLDISLVDRDANVEMYFAPQSQFSRIEPNYRPRNSGFFWTWWNNYEINRARILISTTEVNQRERAHLIREEVTQALGLMRDSDRYSDSIFYQRWTDVTEYSELDKAVIRMLYQPQVRPGMTRSQVVQALNSNTAQTSDPDCRTEEVRLDFSVNSSHRHRCDSAR
jgi:uncharacterized protein YgiM (DUF1202 family)